MTKASDNVFPRLLISEGGSTTTPAAGNVTVYAKADGLLYSKDDAGAETALGGGAGLSDHTHAVTGSGATGGGATLNPTSFSPTGLIAFASGIDSAVNADQNDFNPASLHTVFSVRFTSFSANRTVTGINAGATGEMKLLINNTGFSLLLTNESGSSAAANRFRCPNAATHTVRTGGSALIGYFAGRWCVIAA